MAVVANHLRCARRQARQIHAPLIDQILAQSFLVRPDWAVGAEILFTPLFGALLMFALPLIGARPSAVVRESSVAAALATSRPAFRYVGLLIGPGLSVGGPDARPPRRLASGLLKYQSAFSRYMSPH
jgi:hypothetical protein